MTEQQRPEAAPPRGWGEALPGFATKLAGLWGTWSLVAFCYAIGRWYWSGPYLFAMRVLLHALPVLLALSIPYLLWIERRGVAPRDGSWHMGRLLLGHPPAGAAAREALADHARAWAVKGFFTAFMLSTLPGNWSAVMTADVTLWRDDPVALAEGLVAVMFMVDVTLATVGYIVTLRPLDSHIRSANPYAAGWTAALICYPPFILMNGNGPLDYGVGLGNWKIWLGQHPWLLALDAFALIALTALYAWATMAFGLRFSNLTHRGILTHGPYRWSKHPAYLSKNLFWWLSSMPFFWASGGWENGARNTAILALIGGVYYWRARTEERHLSVDPTYRAYAAYMDRHGPVTRRLRALLG